MKTSRLIWVILANVLAVLINMAIFDIVVTLHFTEGMYHWSYIVYLAIRTVIPVFGIYLEAVDSRLAMWVNTGYFTSFGVVSYGLGLLTSDSYGYTGQLLLVPITAAAVTCFLYSKLWIPSSPSSRVLSFR